MSRHVRLQPAPPVRPRSVVDTEPATVDLRLADLTAAAAPAQQQAARPMLRLPQWDPLPPQR